MKKLILLSIITLAGFISNAQCVANFTMSVNGNTVQLTNTSSGTNFYNWSFGDGGNSSAVNPTYTYSNAGTYDICLTAYFQDSIGGFCIDTLCQTVTVIDTMGGGGSSCNADFTWSVSGNTVLFTNTSTGTNMNDWSFGDGGNSSATNPTYTYASAGTYWVCLYSYYSDSMSVSCSDSVCYQITVQDSTGGGGSSCNADFTWTVSGNTVQFTNTSTGTNMNDWSFGDGGNSTATNPTHTYSSPGSYSVCLYSYYSDSMFVSCSDSVCYQIVVSDSLDSTASIGGITLSEFLLYPNPTNSVLNIQFDQLPGNSHALIVDMLGREMIEVDLTAQITEVQVTELPKGIYLVQLFDANNRMIGMSKFAKE